jgi:hypothetical protein
MAKGFKITLPNGTVIEAPSDMTPDQITAMVSAASMESPTATKSTVNPSENTQSGETYNVELTPEEIWQTSKKERVALFIRSAFTQDLWFTAREVLDEQLTYVSSIVLGETSAIATYLARLFESGYLDKQQGPGRTIRYRMTSKLTDAYPRLDLSSEFSELVAVLELND